MKPVRTGINKTEINVNSSCATDSRPNNHDIFALAFFKDFIQIQRVCQSSSNINYLIRHQLFQQQQKNPPKYWCKLPYLIKTPFSLKKNNQPNQVTTLSKQESAISKSHSKSQHPFIHTSLQIDAQVDWCFIKMMFMMTMIMWWRAPVGHMRSAQCIHSNIIEDEAGVMRRCLTQTMK